MRKQRLQKIALFLMVAGAVWSIIGLAHLLLLL